jgi:hypothetical protein
MATMDPEKFKRELSRRAGAAPTGLRLASGEQNPQLPRLNPTNKPAEGAGASRAAAAPTSKPAETAPEIKKRLTSTRGRAGKRAESDAELVQFANNCYSQARRNQYAEHANWLVSLCYLVGLQWVWFNKYSGTVQEWPRVDKNEVRNTSNRIRPICERVLSQIDAARPRWYVASRSTTEAGYLSSQAWQNWYDWLWTGTGEYPSIEGIVRDEAMLWALVCGRGWTRGLWQSEAGKLHHIPDEQEHNPDEVDEAKAIIESMMGEEGEGELMDAVAEGLPTVACPSPLNVFVDPGSRAQGPFRWLIESTIVHRQEVEDLFGVNVGEATDNSTTTPSISKTVMLGLRDLAGAYASSSPSLGTAIGKIVKRIGLYDGDDEAQLVVMKEMFIAPNKTQPKGRYLVVCGEHLLRDIELPFGRIPHVPWVWTPRLGSREGDGLVGQLRPCQDILNRLKSKAVEIVGYTANAPWVAPEESIVDKRMFNNRSNNFITWRYLVNGQAMPRPERSYPPNVVGNFERLIQENERDMEEIAGLGDSSRGRNPSGGRAAATITALAAQDNQARMPVIRRYSESLTSLAHLLMQITKRCVEEDRLVRVIGLDGEAALRVFKVEDIQDAESVWVQAEPFAPIHNADRGALISFCIQNGLYSPQDPEHRRIILRFLETGDPRILTNTGSMSERWRIHGENLDLGVGIQVPVESFDRHLDHAFGHSEHMRSPTAQELFKKDPAAKKRMQEHLDGHINWLNAQGVPTGFFGTASPSPGGGNPRGTVGQAGMVGEPGQPAVAPGSPPGMVA